MEAVPLTTESRPSHCSCHTSPSQLHVLILAYLVVMFLITHWVQLVLAILSHPMRHGQHAIATPQRKVTSRSSSLHQRPVTLQLGMRPQGPPPPPCLKFELIWSPPDPWQEVTVAVVSCAQQPSHAQKTAIHSTLPCLPALTFFLAPLVLFQEPWERGLMQVLLHLQLSITAH